MAKKKDKKEKDSEKKGKKKENKEGQDIFNQLQKHRWKALSGVLAVALIFSLVFGSGLSITSGNVDQVGKETVDYINSNLVKQGGAKAELVSAEKESGVAKVTISMQGQEMGIYVTMDGKLMFPQKINMSETLTQGGTSADGQQTEIPESEKPKVEAFVSPYCPYGLQYMKGLIPVYNLLKEEADISVKHMGVTHMQAEKPETKERLCIIDEYGKPKFFDYLGEIVYSKKAQECYNVYHGLNLQTNEKLDTDQKGNTTYFKECMNPVIESAMESAGIDSSKVSQCVDEKGDSLYSQSTQYAGSAGEVRGSPTPKINGVVVPKDMRGRSPEAIKSAICSAFTTLPEDCSKSLSTSTPSPGISPLSSESTSTNAGGAC